LRDLLAARNYDAGVVLLRRVPLHVRFCGHLLGYTLLVVQRAQGTAQRFFLHGLDAAAVGDPAVFEARPARDRMLAGSRRRLQASPISAAAMSRNGAHRSSATLPMALRGMSGTIASAGSCASALPPQALIACNPATPSSGSHSG
jgi:hypothetical protein